jgi:hypothetical protein
VPFGESVSPVSPAVQGLLDAKADKSTLTTKGDLYVATASGLLVRKGVGSNGAALVGDSSKSDGLAYEYGPQWFPTYKSGAYYFTASPGNASTTASHNNGTFRALPWVVTKTLTITRIGMEFTAAGDANSVFRLGIYGDDGSGYPTGAPVLDAGTISTGTGNAGTVATGGTPGGYEITLGSPLTLAPGLYWIGGVIQGVTTTQPTIRIANGSSLVNPMPMASIPSSANMTMFGNQMTGATGALPTWSSAGLTNSIVRTFIKVQ